MKNDENLNIFMICEKLNKQALSELDSQFHVRSCREDEFVLWAGFPFDNPEDANLNYGVMLDYFDKVYASQAKLFFEKCLFVCDSSDKPVATGFMWQAYERINTIQWFKTLKDYENQGIGRALLSILLKSVTEEGFPIYIHSHPTCYRAIKLYSDFGFDLLTDKVYGYRNNDIEKCLPILKKHMPESDFNKLRFTKAPEYFKEAVKLTVYEQF